MSISISQFLNIELEKFAKTGALDAIIDMDAKLFIDPRLLKHTETPELLTSYANIQEYFSKLLKIVTLSQDHEDRYWDQATRMLTFPNVRGLGIVTRTLSSILDEKLRNKILENMKSAVSIGIRDSEIFELSVLFEKQVGPELISGIFASVIINKLGEYSERVYRQLGVRTVKLKIGSKCRKVVLNPFNQEPLILVPREILHDLPLLNGWRGILDIIKCNEKLRSELHLVIRRSGKRFHEITKEDIQDILLKNPKIFKDLIATYRISPCRWYDFNIDPAGQIIWQPISQQYVGDHPLFLSLPSEPTVYDVKDVAFKICQEFKRLIEDEGLYILFYDGLGRPKGGEAAQKLFYGIADSYCALNNLDLVREINGITRFVEFKFGEGYNFKFSVGVILTTSSNLIQSVETQLDNQIHVSDIDESILLIIDVGVSKVRLDQLWQKIILYHEQSGKKPDFLYIDCHS